jgi:hypothetical protein
MNTTEHCIEVCNKLLRGERSAVETYDLAIRKFGNDSAMTELNRLREHHVDAVAALEENVLSMGGQPDASAGAWGVFANTVQGAANLFGANSALEALQKGEQSGLGDYQKALEDEDVMAECKTLIQCRLLPRTAEHVTTLDRLQKAA